MFTKGVKFMKKEELIDVFIENGASLNTAKSYVQDVIMLEKWLNKDILDATRMDLTRYIEYMTKDKKSSPATINRTVYSLKKFYELMEVEPNPASKLRRVKLQKRSPEYFNEKEMETVINNLSDRNYERNKLIIALASICGLRKSEIVELDVENFDGRKIDILGKGNKMRSIMVPDSIGLLIYRYLNGRKSGPMFLSERGNRISVGAIGNIMRMLKQDTGMDVHMHKFRHTAATNAYRQDKDIRAVQEMLGHSSVNTTQIYITVDDNRIKELMENSPIISKII